MQDPFLPHEEEPEVSVNLRLTCESHSFPFDITAQLESAHFQSKPISLVIKDDKDGKYSKDVKISGEAILDDLVLKIKYSRKAEFAGEIRVGVEDVESLDVVSLGKHVQIHMKLDNAALDMRTELRKKFSEKSSPNAEAKAWVKEFMSNDFLCKFLADITPAHNISENAFEVAVEKPWLRGHIDNIVAGPAIVYAMHLNVGMLVYYLLVYFILGYIILPSCTFVGTPIALLVFYVCSASLKLWREFAVLGCILPAKVLRGGPPKVSVPWPCDRSYVLKPSVWIFTYVLGSLVTSFDIFSSPLLLARMRAEVFKTRRDAWNVDDAWVRSMETTDSLILRTVSGALGGYPTFNLMIWLSLFSIVAQFMIAIAHNVPVSDELQAGKTSPQAVLYDFRPQHATVDTTENRIRKKHNEFNVCGCSMTCSWVHEVEQMKNDGVFDFAQYNTIFEEYQSHGRALIALLKSGRMSMALSLDGAYVTQSVQHWKVREIQDYQRQSCRFFILFMAQRLLTTSLQSSFVGILRNVSSNRNLCQPGFDSPFACADTLSSIAVMMGCATTVCSVISEVKSCVELHNKLFARADELLSKADIHAQIENQKRQQFRRDKFWARVTTGITCVFALFSLHVTMYNFSKSIFVGQCECGMWNVHKASLSGEWGFCVTFDQGCRMNSTWVNDIARFDMPKWTSNLDLGVPIPQDVCRLLA